MPWQLWLIAGMAALNASRALWSETVSDEARALAVLWAIVVCALLWTGSH